MQLNPTDYPKRVIGFVGKITQYYRHNQIIRNKKTTNTPIYLSLPSLYIKSAYQNSEHTVNQMEPT